MTRNPLWERIEQYMDDPGHRYRPKPADLSRDSGVSEQVLSKWKAKPVLPKPLHLIAFAAGTGIPYAELLTAVMEGRTYLPPGTSARIVFDRDEEVLLKDLGDMLVEELKASSTGDDPWTDLVELPAETEPGRISRWLLRRKQSADVHASDMRGLAYVDEIRKRTGTDLSEPNESLPEAANEGDVEEAGEFPGG